VASGPDFSAKFSAPPEFSGGALEKQLSTGRAQTSNPQITNPVLYKCATVTLFIISILRVFMQMFPLLVLLVASMLLLWSMMLLASMLLKVFLLLLALLLVASMLLSLLMLFLAPMYLLTEKGADIMCYQITMRTCTVAIYKSPRFKMVSPESGAAD
jgi:hypothetical protein